MSSSTITAMTESQFKALSEIIYDRAGIRFPETKKYIVESRLGHRLAELELTDFDQYITFLTMGPYQSDEFQEMFDRITLNDTSFFRNEPQLGVFENKILPQLLEAREATKRLRIWSAACSTGEEAFTLAIILHRALGDRLKDWTVEILGTDLSERALNIANAGVYSNFAMRSTPDAVKSRYFSESDGRWTLDDEIRSMVNFEIHNLKDRAAAQQHGSWDVIFCRNVMTYFDDEMKSRVAGMFADRLAENGTLFIGHSENLRGLESCFEGLPHAQGFCFRATANPSANAA